MALDVTGKLRYPPPRPDWLAQVQEDIIEPELAIVDPHHHIWVQDGHAYGLDELRSDVQSGHRVVATVLVQAHHAYRDSGPEHLRCVGETEHIEQIVAAQGQPEPAPYLCAGIVGYADMLLGAAVEEVLQAHQVASPQRFRGVRHSVGRDPYFPEGIVLRPAPAQLLADARYRAGLAAVARAGLSYDAMLYHCQIAELTEVARALPELPIVLDHFGCIIGVGPYVGREQETFAAWRHDVVDLARCPNVSVKLGGMGMVICGARFHDQALPPNSRALAQLWRPYVETCIEAFGVERCMFESNFPVDKGMFSYAVLWNAFKRLAAGASTDEKAALFGHSAARFYRLPQPVQRLLAGTGSN